MSLGVNLSTLQRLHLTQTPFEYRIAYDLEMTADWIFDRMDRATFLSDLGFSVDFQKIIEPMATQIAADPQAKADFLKTASRYVDYGEMPLNPPADPIWSALLALSGHSQMRDAHQRRKIPRSVTQATALDLQRWVKDTLSGGGGIATIPLPWVIKPIRQNLLEIGRLQYLSAPFGYPYQVFVQRSAPNRVVALADPGMQCSKAGWPCEKDAYFETALRHEEDVIYGNPLDPVSGRILYSEMALRLNEWDLVLKNGDLVLDVHIPSGVPLTKENCRASFSEAEQVFLQCFSELNWRAFVCTSWLLDRELANCLPGTSGILAFGHFFYPLATRRPNFRQLTERVLNNTSDWRTFQPRTSLQKSVIAHLADGGTFRTTSGFRLRSLSN